MIAGCHFEAVNKGVPIKSCAINTASIGQQQAMYLRAGRAILEIEGMFLSVVGVRLGCHLLDSVHTLTPLPMI